VDPIGVILSGPASSRSAVGRCQGLPVVRRQGGVHGGKHFLDRVPALCGQSPLPGVRDDIESLGAHVEGIDEIPAGRRFA
jgi:hypothetical protein